MMLRTLLSVSLALWVAYLNVDDRVESTLSALTTEETY